MLIATITQQRSGSKFLGSVLRKQLGLLSLGELFYPVDWSAPYSFRQFILARGFERAFRDGPEATLNQYFDGFAPLGRALHFDLMFNQLEWPVVGYNPYPREFLYGYLRARDAVVLSLVRNVFDVFLSEKTLMISRTAHVFDHVQNPKSSCDVATESLSGRRVRLDPAEYVSFAQAVGIRRRALREAFCGYRFFAELNYEALASAASIDPTSVDLIREAARYHGIAELADGNMATIPAPVRVQPEYDRLFENVEELRHVKIDPAA
jgi:hypothetical protein